MKKQTAETLQKYLPRFSFALETEGLKIDHDLTDEEILEIVESEYGSTSQNVENLFHIIMKKAVKMAVENSR